MSNDLTQSTVEQSQESPIFRALKLIHDPGEVFEIRVLGIPAGKYKPRVAAGWFNDPRAALKALPKYMVQKPSGIYMTLNPVNSALLARTNNLMSDQCAESTSDKDVLRRRWMLIDLDPERPTGISSSDEELEAARAIAKQCKEWLQSEFGWPEPIEAMSGNGMHLVYRIEMPNDDAAKSLIRNVLKVISEQVHEWQIGRPTQIKVDQVVFNAARIVKLWGTTVRKGMDVADRPHRKSDLTVVPQKLAIISTESLTLLTERGLTTGAESQSAPLTPPPTLTGKDVLSRARSYIAKLPPAISGQGGSAATYRAACVLVKDFALSSEDALSILMEWNTACQPPWSPGELIHKLRCATNAPGPAGKLLGHDSRSIPSQRPGMQIDGQPDPDKLAKAVITRPDFVPFPVSCLPEPLRTFLIEGADSMCCDPTFLILPSLAALAAAVGNARRVRLKNQWTEPCVMWTVIIGESGTMKSPAMEAALRFLGDLQKKAIARYEEKMRDYERENIRYELELKEWKRASKEDKSLALPEPPFRPVCERYICSDTTVEALGSILEEQPRGILMVRDELSGWLGSFDAYKSCKGADVASWLSMHRANEVTIDRKTGKRITYIPHAAVSIAGGIQPATMASALAGRYSPPDAEPAETAGAAGREHLDNGLAARLLMAMPPRRAKEWTEQDISPEISEAMEKIFSGLISLEMGKDGNGKPCPIDVRLTLTAQEHWRTFYNEHAQEQVQMNGDVAAAWSKLEGGTARLALLFHLIRLVSGDPTVISPDEIDESSLSAAIKASRWFGDEASRIYLTIGAKSETGLQRQQRLLVRLIKKHGGRLTPRELGRHCRRYRQDVALAESALQGLVESRFGDWEIRSTTEKGGRPTQEFVLAPKSSNHDIPLTDEELDHYDELEVQFYADYAEERVLEEQDRSDELEI